MFGLIHNLYMIISTLITVVGMILVVKFVREPKWKDFVLKVSAIFTVILHFSSLYVDYFTTGSATVDSVMLMPIYPCNVAMWLLVIVAFYRNKESKVFKTLAEMTFYLGVIGGVVGIMFNEIFIDNPTLADWNVLKGLLSHSTMLFGCIYLLAGRYIQIRVANLFSLLLVGVLLLVDGGIIIGLYRIFRLDPPNCMYLLENPFPQIPWMNTIVIGLMAIVLVFVVTAIYEQIALKKEDRWYSRIKLHFEQRRRNEQ